MAPSSVSLFACILFTISIVVSAQDPCTTSTVLNDKWRSSGYISPDNEPLHCDSIMVPGWYRFENATISNYCVGQFYCGTYSTLWINSTDELQTSVQLCQNLYDNCCYWSTVINVERCPDPNARQGYFYVYQLPQFSLQCYYGICTDIVCPTGQVLISGQCIDPTSATAQTSDPSVIISTLSTPLSSTTIVHNQNPVNLGSIPSFPSTTTKPSTTVTQSTSTIPPTINNARTDSIGEHISTPTYPTSTVTKQTNKNSVDDTTDQSTVDGPISNPTNHQTQNEESVNGRQSSAAFPQWAVIVIVILASLLLAVVAILIVTKCKRKENDKQTPKCLEIEEFDGKKKTLDDWQLVKGNDYTGGPERLIGLGQFTLDPRKKTPDIQQLGVEGLYESLDNKLNATKEDDRYAKLEKFQRHSETDSGIHDTELRDCLDKMEANNHIYDDILDICTNVTTDEDDYLKPSRVEANETIG